MKKTLLIVLALILIMALAAGCGNANESTNDNGAGAAEGSEVNGAAVEDEAARSSISLPGLDALDLGDATLEDINERDTEGSFRESSRSMDDWESADNQDGNNQDD